MTGSALSPAVAAAEPVQFCYADLDPKDAELLQDAATQIREWRRLTVRHIIDTGRNLLGAKEVLGHGRFTAWLDAEFGWTDRTARNYMAAAEAFRDKAEIVSDLPPTVVYQLSSPSTPESAREAVLSRLGADNRTSLDEIKEIIFEAKEREKHERAEAKKSADQKARERLNKSRRESRQVRLDERFRADQEMRRAAREAAASFIVARLGADADELLRLLDAGFGVGVDKYDIREALLRSRGGAA